MERVMTFKVSLSDHGKEVRCKLGDNFTADEIRQTWKETPLAGGKLDYEAFVKQIKRGKDDE
jgi:hypothetical protein